MTDKIIHIKNEFGFHLYSVDEIDSTNTYFKNHYQEYKDFSILVAKKQTQGRGRYIRKWISDDDLCFSLLTFSTHHYEILSPLAVMRALRRLNLSAFIKWPNDIYVQDKKISGILIEDIYQGKALKANIIGIGINMSNKDEVNGIGISSFIKIEKEKVLSLVLEELHSLLNAPFETVIKEYTSNNLILNRRIIFHDEELDVIAFTSQGYLIARRLNGEERIIKSDEINIKQSLA